MTTIIKGLQKTGAADSVDPLSGRIEVDLRKDHNIDMLHVRPSRTMIDYLIGLSEDNLSLWCDVGSLWERDRENRKKLIRVNDEKNWYISLDSSKSYYDESERDPGPTYELNQTLYQNWKEYISKDLQEWIHNLWYAKYRKEDYNIAPLYQMVRYYNKQKEPIIVINVQWGWPMCSRLSFLKEDSSTRNVVSVEDEVRSDIVCKDTKLSLSADETNFIASNNISNIDIFNELWLFPQKGTRVLHINESGEIDGYVVRDGSKFGCEE